jgi:hypothetical protein
MFAAIAGDNQSRAVHNLKSGPNRVPPQRGFRSSERQKFFPEFYDPITYTSLVHGGGNRRSIVGYDTTRGR